MQIANLFECSKALFIFHGDCVSLEAGRWPSAQPRTIGFGALFCLTDYFEL